MQTFSEWLREKEGSETEYQKFFNKKLEKYGVKSASELSVEDKKKFFDEVDAEWEGENEEPEADDKDVNEKLEVSEGERESTIFIDKTISKDFKIEVFDMDDIVNVTFKGKVLFESDLSEFKKFIFDINTKIKDL